MKTLRNNQKGLSLIELMIGIVLGSLIIIVVLYMLSASRASSQLIAAESRMQDNIQYAIEVLTSTIRQAGYVSNSSDDYTTITVGGVDGDIIHGEDDGDSSTPDTITVYYQGNDDGAITNCVGDVINDSSALVFNQFSIGTNGSLQCDPDSDPAINPRPLIGKSQPDDIDSKVTNFQVLYGLDTDASGSVNQYRSMDQITTAVDREKIIAVTFQITLEEQIGADTLSKTFTSGVYLRNKI